MSTDAVSDNPEQHTLYLLMFACRYKQMKLCAVQTESAAGETLVTVSLLPAERRTDARCWSCSSSVFSLLLFVCEDLDWTWELSKIWSFISVFVCDPHQAPVWRHKLITERERKRRDWKSWRVWMKGRGGQSLSHRRHSQADKRISVYFAQELIEAHIR